MRIVGVRSQASGTKFAVRNSSRITHHESGILSLGFRRGDYREGGVFGATGIEEGLDAAFEAAQRVVYRDEAGGEVVAAELVEDF